jgi:hypothetical protein
MHTMTKWCARLMLALMSLGFAASANASTIYNFTFTDLNDNTLVVASGSFTTNGTPNGSGYELVTFMSFDYATAADGTVYTGPFTTSRFATDAGYNPTTAAFTSSFRDSLGFISLEHDLGHNRLFLDLKPDSFSERGLLLGLITGSIDVDLRGGWLAVATGVHVDDPPPPPTVPEPTSLALFGTGLLGAVVSRRRHRAR